MSNQREQLLQLDEAIMCLFTRQEPIHSFLDLRMEMSYSNPFLSNGELKERLHVLLTRGELMMDDTFNYYRTWERAGWIK